jgi:acetolactate synthase-1/2/3 large subunit
MKVSDFVIKFLLDNGIDTTFTISGGGCIHLIDSLRKSDMQVFCPHHEQTALMAAEGYTRMSGKICASIVTTGPGGTNALTGLLGLWLDSIPSIIISGQVPLNQISKGTGCRQIGDQEFDIISTVKSMTKYSVMVSNPNDIYYELEKAYKISNSGRPGPVWIDIPLDIQGASIDLNTCKRFDDCKTNDNTDNNYIGEFTDMINQSKKPLVIVGNGINLSKTNKQLNVFLNKTGIPVVTGPHSGIDAVDNTYEYYSGRIGILGQLSSNKIVQDSDLLICLGTRLPVKMTGYNINEFSPNSKKIMVDIDNNEISKHKFKIDLKINTDLNIFFENIKNIEYTNEISEWQFKVKDLRSNQKYYHKKHIDLKDYASFYYFISKCSDVFNKTPIVTSNGTAHVVTLQNYKINKDQKLFTNVGCASMGYGLPASIGACVANDKQPVICIEGDGSIMMNLQELQTVVGYKLPVKIIVVNNDGYLSIKLTQESFFDGKEFASGKDSGVTIPDFKSISDAFGIPYNSIRTNTEIDDRLNWFMSQDNACILEIFTHPKERHEPKVTHKGLDENGKIIPGTLTDMFISETF